MSVHQLTEYAARKPLGRYSVAVIDKELMLHATAPLRTDFDLVLLDWGTKKASFRGWQLREPLTRAEITFHCRRKLHNVGIWLGREPPRSAGGNPADQRGEAQ